MQTNFLNCFLSVSINVSNYIKKYVFIIIINGCVILFIFSLKLLKLLKKNQKTYAITMCFEREASVF